MIDTLENDTKVVTCDVTNHSYVALDLAERGKQNKPEFVLYCQKCGTTKNL